MQSEGLGAVHEGLKQSEGLGASGKHRSIGAVRAQATDEKPHAPSSTATNMDLLHLNHVRNARVARF